MVARCQLIYMQAQYTLVVKFKVLRLAPTCFSTYLSSYIVSTYVGMHHLRLVTVTSLYKRVLLDIHLKMEMKSSVAFEKVIVGKYELFNCSCSTVPEIFSLIHSTISF